MLEFSSIIRGLEMYERQAWQRDRARREQSGVPANRERRWSFRKVTRHAV